MSAAETGSSGSDQYVVEVQLLLSRSSVSRGRPFNVLRVQEQSAFAAQGLLRFYELQLVLLAQVGKDEVEVALVDEHDSPIPARFQPRDQRVEHVFVIDHVADSPLEEEKTAPADLVDSGRRHSILDVPAVDPADDHPAFLRKLAQDHVGHAQGYADTTGEIPLADRSCALVVIDALQESKLVICKLLRVQTVNTIYRKKEESSPSDGIQAAP